MSHDHSHDHSHGIRMTHVSRMLAFGILLNCLFVLIEAATGFWQNSLALLSDAGHNLADVACLGLSWLAFRLAKVRPNKHYTYGYRKTTILVALLNAVILLVAIGGIGFEAVRRLNHPTSLSGGVMAVVSGIGILVNGLTAWLFMKEKEKDLNIRGAYLHMAADALVSLGVVAAGLVIMGTGWYWLDPAISFVIMFVILAGTWNLLKDSIRLSLDGVPPEIDLEAVRLAAGGIKGVQDIHHIHVWAISTTQNALTAHLVVQPGTDFRRMGDIKQELRHALEHLNIQHSTFETETWDTCQEKECSSSDETG